MQELLLTTACVSECVSDYEYHDSDDDNIYGEEMYTFHSTQSLIDELGSVSTHSLTHFGTPHKEQCGDDEVALLLQSLTPPSTVEKAKYMSECVSECVSECGSGSGSGSDEFHTTSLMVNNSLTTVVEVSAADYSRWTGRCDVSDNTTLMTKVLTRYYGLEPTALSGITHPYSHSLTHSHTHNTHPAPASPSPSPSPSRTHSLTQASIVHILEVVLRPDTPTHFIMMGVERVASLLHLRYESIMSSSEDVAWSPNVHTSTTSEDPHYRSSGSGSGSGGHAVLWVGDECTSRVESGASWRCVDVQVSE
jgi:hypothetical protein